MKFAFSLLLFSVFCVGFAQSDPQQYYKEFETIKSGVSINGNDRRFYELLDDMYDDVLQADDGELSKDTEQNLMLLATEPDAANKHLLYLLAGYQAFLEGNHNDGAAQLQMIEKLRDETHDTYGQVPVLLDVYKGEALVSAGKTADALTFFRTSLQKYPNSIPLKVYVAIYSKDKKLQKQLATDHPNHWLVKKLVIR
jgi:hypothetical protein